MEGRDPGKRKADDETAKKEDASAKKARASYATMRVGGNQGGTGDVSGTAGGDSVSSVDASLTLGIGVGDAANQDVPHGGSPAAMNQAALNAGGHLSLRQFPQVSEPRKRRAPLRLMTGFDELDNLLSPDFLERALAAAGPELWARVDALGASSASSKNPPVSGPAVSSGTLQLLDKLDVVHPTSGVAQGSASNAASPPKDLQLGPPLTRHQQLLHPEQCPYCDLRRGTRMAQPIPHGCLCTECLTNPDAVCPVCSVRGKVGSP